ncbi:MAG: hypothetical protein LH628_17470 [Microcoleus sp. CAN_BIN18]|nr:hypothetical protein [Microcoleus sp. CAN_BIN18]
MSQRLAIDPERRWSASRASSAQKNCLELLAIEFHLLHLSEVRCYEPI